VRDYSEGEWLLLLWGAIAFVLIAGLFLGVIAMVVIALLAAAGAGYTPFLYVQQLGPRPAGPTDPDSDRNEGGFS
ncbi:hypothetical protein ABTF88_21520, partial [Acinetobacter baumannii]